MRERDQRGGQLDGADATTHHRSARQPDSVAWKQPSIFVVGGWFRTIDYLWYLAGTNLVQSGTTCLNWPKSEAEFRRALDLGASAETRGRYGWALAAHWRFHEAHEQIRLAAEQDPRSRRLRPSTIFLPSILSAM